MRKTLIVLCAAAAFIAFPAHAQSDAAAAARANVAAVKAAAVQVIQTKGAKSAVDSLKTAVDAVKADVQAVKADASATKAEQAIAQREAVQTKAILSVLKSLAAAKKPTGN